MKCQHCQENEAEVDVEIPIPKNGTEEFRLCIKCATEVEDHEIEQKRGEQNGRDSS